MRRKKDEHVVASLAGDEAVALLSVEPLDGALRCHCFSQPIPEVSARAWVSIRLLIDGCGARGQVTQGETEPLGRLPDEREERGDRLTVLSRVADFATELTVSW
jgi:hypothetical protein